MTLGLFLVGVALLFLSLFFFLLVVALALPPKEDEK